jgi:hypothetical protein
MIRFSQQLLQQVVAGDLMLAMPQAPEDLEEVEVQAKPLAVRGIRQAQAHLKAIPVAMQLLQVITVVAVVVVLVRRDQTHHHPVAGLGVQEFKVHHLHHLLEGLAQVVLHLPGTFLAVVEAGRMVVRAAWVGMAAGVMVPSIPQRVQGLQIQAAVVAGVA